MITYDHIATSTTEFPTFAFFFGGVYELDISPGYHRGIGFDAKVEAYLDGSFTKHSSNSGFVADDVVRTLRQNGQGRDSKR